MTVDLTGCEHMSRDIGLIERIAAVGSDGPTEVVYLYEGAAPVAQMRGLEKPFGAIENGRIFLDRVEQQYSFECEAGPLNNCADWHEVKRCFEFMAEFISLAPATNGFNEAIERAAAIAETGDWYGQFQTQGDQRRAEAIAARIRALSAREASE